MKACLFGTYDRPHSANRLLRQALSTGGFELLEIHEPLWEETHDKDRRYFGPVSMLGLGARYAAAARRLAKRWKRLSGPPPLVFVGFGGQLDMLLAERICRPRAGLVFAPLVSLTETLIDDRALFSGASARGRLVGALDRRTLSAADLVLVDTAAHADYLKDVGAHPDRMLIWYLGAEPEFIAEHAPAPRPGRVLFYGRYVPLHGTETIVRAAGLLGSAADFVMIGEGPERGRVQALARKQSVEIDWRDEIPLEELPKELAAASAVLGIFGATKKAEIVVPNKVFQAAAAGRPLVTRDTPALREILTPDEHCLACPPSDPEALAGQIARLLREPERAERLGRAARTRILERFSAAQQAERLAGALRERFGAGGA